MWNLVEPELLRTFMWDLVEPELLKMEPLCGTSRNLAEPGARFQAAAPNHPEALLEEPQAFQAVGEKLKQKHRAHEPERSQVLVFEPSKKNRSIITKDQWHVTLLLETLAGHSYLTLLLDTCWTLLTYLTGHTC